MTAHQNKDLDILFSNCLQRQFGSTNLAGIRQTCSKLAGLCTYSGSVFTSSSHWLKDYKKEQKLLAEGVDLDQLDHKKKRKNIRKNQVKNIKNLKKKAKKQAKKQEKKAKKQAKKEEKKVKKATKNPEKTAKKQEKEAKKQAKKQEKQVKKQEKEAKKEAKKQEKTAKNPEKTAKKSQKKAKKQEKKAKKQAKKEKKASKKVAKNPKKQISHIKGLLKKRNTSISRYAACLAFIPEDRKKDALDNACLVLKQASESAFNAEQCWAKYLVAVSQCKTQGKKKKQKACYKKLAGLDRPCWNLAKKSEEQLKVLFSQKEAELK